MAEKYYPKVLIVCVDSWRDDVGANTFPKFFSEWDPDRVAVIYTKSELPNSPYSNHFFQISENDVVHASIHYGKKCGKEVHNESVVDKNSLDYEYIEKAVKEEGKRYSFFRQHRWKLFYLIRDLIWGLGAWKSKELDRFIKDFNPEVIFFPIYPYIYMNKIQSYVAKKTGIRGVAYIADDCYSYKPEWYNPLFWIQRFFLKKTVDDIIDYSDELLVIAPQLLDEYKQVFRIPTNILTKGIDVQNMVYKPQNSKLPLKMVYTGNMFIGRDKSIIKVANAIKRINRNGTVIELYIYSHVIPSKKVRKAIDIPGSSYFMGSVPISEVTSIQNSADIVLFVEALDIFNRNKARLSFSTKLTDYFKSGKCIFAVGKRDIVPIAYLSKNKCAIIADSEKNIYKKLKKLVDNPSLINSYGRKSFEVGLKNHSDVKMRSLFYNSLFRVSNNSK